MGMQTGLTITLRVNPARYHFHLRNSSSSKSIIYVKPFGITQFLTQDSRTLHLGLINWKIRGKPKVKVTKLAT